MARVSKHAIKREPGYLYYLGSDGYVWAAPMKSNPHGRKKRAGTEHIARVKGGMYYVDKQGYVARSR